MKWQVVQATVSEGARERYLVAWTEWSGVLFQMGIETELLEREGRRGRFVEIARFDSGDEAALGDDRLVRLQADLDAACDAREGDLGLLREVDIGEG